MVCVCVCEDAKDLGFKVLLRGKVEVWNCLKGVSLRIWCGERR